MRKPLSFTVVLTIIREVITSLQVTHVGTPLSQLSSPVGKIGEKKKDKAKCANKYSTIIQLPGENRKGRLNQ